MPPRNSRKKTTPQSRRRYEKNNPVVSVRVSQEIYEELTSFKKASGKSMADLLKAGLDKIKPNYDEAYEEGSMWGYDVGYADARRQYEVGYWCARCGNFHLSITTDEEKESAANMMYEAGWEQTDCQG